MVDNVQPRSLPCFRIRKRRHENRMDLRRANSPEPLNMTWAGERSEQPRSFQSPEMFFLLTLPFIERANRKLSHYRPVVLRARRLTFFGHPRPSQTWALGAQHAAPLHHVLAGR